MKPLTIVDKKADEAQRQLDNDAKKIDTIVNKVVEQYGKIFDMYGLNDYYISVNVVLGTSYIWMQKINDVYPGVAAETKNFFIDKFCEHLQSLKTPVIEVSQ